jgi:hypothetical protein
LITACAVYDPSLLRDERGPGSDTGGTSLGGEPTLSGGTTHNGEGGKSSNAGASAMGGEAEDGGASSGSSTSKGGSTTQGGGGDGDAGERAMGGSVTSGGASTGGTTPRGGSTSDGGNTATGGDENGGTPSTGGATGGTSNGGTLSTGGVTGTGGMSDGCPSDPNKTAPGVCGCGFPELDSGTAAGCLGLRSALVHRYTFAGSNGTISDSKGTAHGTAVNATTSNGSLTLVNTSSEQYADLPNKLLSPLSNATIEVWTTWSGGANWQRIFDFGSTNTEGVRGAGKTYLYVTPKTISGVLRVGLRVPELTDETLVSSSPALPSGVVSHLSVVVNDASDQILLYVNGAVAGTTAFTGHLSGLNDINNWLGRSQFVADAGFAGVLHDFRIYNVALNAAQIELTEKAGPDPTFF